MKELAHEFLMPFKDAFVTRFASPLTLSFLISWALYNYKFILIVLSNNNISTIFSLLEKHVYPTRLDHFTSIFFPSIFAITYIFIYDPIAAKVQIWKLSRDTGHKNEKRTITEKEVLTPLESAKINAERVAQKERHALELAEANKRTIKAENDLLRLSRALAEAEERASVGTMVIQQSKYSFQPNSLSNEHLSVLNQLIDKGSYTRDTLIDLTKIPVEEIEKKLTDLINFEIVGRSCDGLDVEFYLTDLGKEMMNTHFS